MKRLSLLFMLEQNKNYVVDAIFVKTLTWICQSYDMDLSNLLHGFVKTKL